MNVHFSCINPDLSFPTFLGMQHHNSITREIPANAGAANVACERWRRLTTHTGNRHFFDDDNFMIIMIIMKPSIIINSIYHQKLDQ